MDYHFMIIMVISVFKIYKYLKVTSFLKMVCLGFYIRMSDSPLPPPLSPQASKYNIVTNWFMISKKIFQLNFS